MHAYELSISVDQYPPNSLSVYTCARTFRWCLMKSWLNDPSCMCHRLHPWLTRHFNFRRHNVYVHPSMQAHALQIYINGTVNSSIKHPAIYKLNTRWLGYTQLCAIWSRIRSLKSLGNHYYTCTLMYYIYLPQFQKSILVATTDLPMHHHEKLQTTCWSTIHYAHTYQSLYK